MSAGNCGYWSARWVVGNVWEEIMGNARAYQFEYIYDSGQIDDCGSCSWC